MSDREPKNAPQNGLLAKWMLVGMGLKKRALSSLDNAVLWQICEHGTTPKRARHGRLLTGWEKTLGAHRGPSRTA
jgi:hypothetical protein